MPPKRKRDSVCDVASKQGPEKKSKVLKKNSQVVDDGKAAKADELASRKAPKRGDVGAAAPKSKAKKIPKSIQPRPGTECEKLPSILNSGLRKPGEVPWVQRTHGDAGAPATGAVYVSPSIYIYIYICPRQTKKYRKC